MYRMFVFQTTSEELQAASRQLQNTAVPFVCFTTPEDDMKNNGDVLCSPPSSHSLVGETFSDAGETVRVQQTDDNTETQNTQDPMSSRSKRTQTGKKRHSCQVCHKEFPKLSVLEMHKRIHNNIKPYKCDTCHKSFTLLGNLRVHQRIHSGERPYICGVCTKAFRTSGNLAEHRRTQHRNVDDVLSVSDEYRQQTNALSSAVICDVHDGENTDDVKNNCDVSGSPSQSCICSCLEKLLELSKVFAQTHTNESPSSCDLFLKKYKELCYLETDKHIDMQPRQNVYPKVSNTRSHPGTRKHNDSHEKSRTVCGKKPFSERHSLTLLKHTYTNETSHTSVACHEGLNTHAHLIAQKPNYTNEKVVNPHGSYTCDKSSTEINSFPLHQHTDVNEIVDAFTQVNDSKVMDCDVSDDSLHGYDSLCTRQNSKAPKQTHAHDKPYICKDCNKKFHTAGELRVHSRIHTNERPYICTFCPKAFAQASTLQIHKRSHTGERPYLCSFCTKAFTTSKQLTVHRRIHTNEKPYSCELCHKAFTQISSLKVHRRTHTGEKPYICDVCAKMFTSISSFTYHKQTHTDLKPYCCDLCEKKFTASSTLKIHKRTHSGETPYVCDICAKMFHCSSLLNQHKETHANEKTYVCEICHKRFTRLRSLKRHKIVHTGKRLKVPNECAEMTNASSSLNSNLKPYYNTGHV